MSNSQVLTLQSRRQSKPLNIQPRGYDAAYGAVKQPTQQRQRSMGQQKEKISSILLNSGMSPCVFCKNFRQNQPFTIMVGRALFSKYSASQNYYYSKDINELISNQRTQVVIRVKDTAAFDEEDEYLNRFYAFHEYDGKIRRLTEYYKFHRDIARMFMLPTTTTLNKYHDKKRRIYYIQITKMLKEKEGKKDTPPPSNSPPAPQSSEKNRKMQNSNEDKEEHFQSFQLSERVLPSSLDDTEMGMKSVQSNTLQDLNSRLNDILLNSTQNTQSYFYENEVSQTIGNLSNFLKHLQKQNSQANQYSNNKPDFFGQIDKRAQFKIGEQQQLLSQISSRTVQNNQEQPEPNQLILQKDSKIFTKKTSGSQIFSSARSSLDLKSKQIVTSQNVNQQKIQNDEKAMQIYQMNQEMIALGILKPSSKIPQTLPHLDTDKITSNGVLSHGLSPAVSPGIAQDWSPLVQNTDSQTLFKKNSTNEALGSPKEFKDNLYSKTKEGTIILAAKESLKSQHTFKMAVSIEATKLNSHNQSFEAIKSPLVIQHFKDDKQHEESSHIKISNTKTNFNPNSNQVPQPAHSISPAKKTTNIGSSQHQRIISSDKNLSDANRKQDFPETQIISQDNLSQQFKLHLQQRQSEEEVKAGKRKHTSYERTENKYNPYSALNAPNTDRPVQPKQSSLQSSLSSRENREKEDKNNGKRLKTYEPIITKRENQNEFKTSLHRSKGDPFPQQQNALGLVDRSSILKTNEGKKLSFFNHLSSQGSLLSDEAMSPIKLQNKLSAQSEGVKSQTNLMSNSNQIRSPTLENRVILDSSPQKQSGGSLHVSKSKTTFSTAVLSQSIPSNIKLSQLGSQNNPNDFEQRTTETQMSKTRRTKENKGSISEIPEFQMSQSSSLYQNINPELVSQQNAQSNEGDTAPVRKLSNQLSQKSSLITNKFENLKELKQFYKEVQRRTDAASQQKDREDNKQITNGQSDTQNSQELQKIKVSSQRNHNRDEEILQKGTITQRAPPYTQESSNSKEISPRIQRLIKQDLKSQDTNTQSSFTIKQVLPERDTSNRRNSAQLKSSSNSSSTNLIPYGNTQKFSSTIGQAQTISSVQREQDPNSASKILQFKQLASKNSTDNLTTSSISTLETARKNQAAVLRSGINGGSNGISPIPGPKQTSFTILAESQLQQQYGGGQANIVGNGYQQGSSVKVMDKIKHSRINSMGSATSSYPSASSAAGIQTQPSQIKQLNQGYGQYPLQQSASQQQLQPQQFLINSNSQLSAAMPSNSNAKQIHHKYTKSEIDYVRQSNQQTQVLTSNLALSAANLPISYATKSGIPTQSNFNLLSQPQISVQDTKRGMMSLHTQGSQQSSQSPQRGGPGKKSLDQQQFFTYANNNIVNIYVNSQEGGAVIKTNNIINNYNQNLHQNIGQVINSQINANKNGNMQQGPTHGLVPPKKQTNGVISKVRQDYLPSYSKF